MQHRLVTEHSGIETLPLVTGWSMGAGQTYQCAVSHPDMVQRALPFCGSPKTSEHNIVFLEAVKAAIQADAAYQGGCYDEQPVKGLRAAARVYAGWGFSQAFYWERVYLEMGDTSLEDFLVAFWEGFFLDDRDANNLLTMLWTWQNGDVGTTPGFDGDTAKALGSIKADLIGLPAEKDLYFPPEDEEHWIQYAGMTRTSPAEKAASSPAQPARLPDPSRSGCGEPLVEPREAPSHTPHSTTDRCSMKAKRVGMARRPPTRPERCDGRADVPPGGDQDGSVAVSWARRVRPSSGESPKTVRSPATSAGSCTMTSRQIRGLEGAGEPLQRVRHRDERFAAVHPRAVRLSGMALGPRRVTCEEGPLGELDGVDEHRGLEFSDGGAHHRRELGEVQAAGRDLGGDEDLSFVARTWAL